MKSFPLFIAGIITAVPVHGQIIKGEGAKSEVKLVCFYRMTYRPDSTTATVVTENTQLLIAKDLSEFRSKNLFARDSARNAIIAKADASGMNNSDLGNSITKMLKIPGPKISYIIYKTHKKLQCTVYDNIMEQNYQYNEPDRQFIWSLTNDRTLVGGYSCQKATTEFAGRKYDVWFTREIPISDGPYKFNGLPGLIVKVSDIGNNYTFELVRLTKPTKQSVISLPSQPVITTTKGEFFRAARASLESSFDRAGQYGVTFKQPDEARRSLREKLKKANNPLEVAY